MLTPPNSLWIIILRRTEAPDETSGAST